MIEIASWITNILVLGLGLTLLAVGCFCIMLVIMAIKDMVKAKS